MSRIFLSHSSKDDVAAVAIRDWLNENGWNDVFLDLDPAQGIHPGERWKRALYEHATRCEAVLFLVSHNWLSSDWCRREYKLARKLNRRIFVVLIDDIAIKDLPSFLTETHQAGSLASGSDHQWRRVTLTSMQEERNVTFSTEGLTRLKAGLTQAGLDPRFFAWPPENEPNRAPYRGLEPLEAVDAGIFFGRDAPVIEAFDALRALRDGASPRFAMLASLLPMTGFLAPILDFGGTMQATGGRFGAIEGRGLTPASREKQSAAPTRRRGKGRGRDHSHCM